MRLNTKLKLILSFSFFIPAISFAQNYRNGIAEMAAAYDALYSRYGMGGVKARTAMAHSDCGEIYNANSAGYSCAACAEHMASHQCAPVRKHDVAIIDNESRGLLNEREYKALGASVGTLECKNAKGRSKLTTAFVVATGVLKASAHAAYLDVLDAKGNPTGKQTKAFNLATDCVLALRDKNSENVKRYGLEEATECAENIPDTALNRCDWAIIKVKDVLPKEAKPLKLLALRAEDLDNVPVVAVGHHHGVVLNQKSVPIKTKLVDYGMIMPKTQNSYIKNFGHVVQYTVDTNGIASGQPIAVQIADDLYVVASHWGEYRRKSVEASGWDDSSHMNYGELINYDMYKAIRKYAPQSEQSHFETKPSVRKFNNQIEI